MMTKALVLTFLLCWGNTESECSVMQKEMDNGVEQCVSELTFVMKDIEKMRAKGNPKLHIQQFKCTYLEE